MYRVFRKHPVCEKNYINITSNKSEYANHLLDTIHNTNTFEPKILYSLYKGLKLTFLEV